LRLRAAHAMDAKEGKRKAKSKKGKAKVVFTEVGAGTAVEAHTTYSDDEEEDIVLSETEEEEDDHASDNEERVKKSDR
jgi:hypothetical protein